MRVHMPNHDNDYFQILGKRVGGFLSRLRSPPAGLPRADKKPAAARTAEKRARPTFPSVNGHKRSMRVL